MKHELVKWPTEVLYPVTPAPHAAAISRAVDRVVKKMRPPSYCYCGRYCHIHRQQIALMEEAKQKRSTRG